jgi:putative PIN family toxin of toxin-antitoxin system
MTDVVVQAVFDCNIFAQAIITPLGNAGRCVERVLDGRVGLYWSSYVLAEIRSIPEKPTPKRLGVTADQVESLIARLIPVAHLLENPPSVYQHPIDPKDSHYVDLAIAADAKLIVSRDKHMLNLVNPAKAASWQFRARFPNLVVLQPEQLLELLRATASG